MSYLFAPSIYLVHQKLGFTDTDLAENFNLVDNIATTDVFYLLIAETSILRTLQQNCFNKECSKLNLHLVKPWFCPCLSSTPRIG